VGGITMTTQKFVIRDQEILDRLIEYIQGVYQDRLYEVLIRPYRTERSLTSNDFYWVSVVTPLSELTGHSNSEIHDILCKQFFGTKSVEFNGKVYELPNRTTTTNENGERDVLPQEEMTRFIEYGHQIATEMGASPPPIPDDGDA